MKTRYTIAIAVVLFIAGSAAFSNKQDDTGYRRYLLQMLDKKGIEGKPGVLLTGLGQPEEYDFRFFDRYLQQIFNAAFPPALKFLILSDKGVVLMDPGHMTASEEFKPEKLVDCFGHEANEQGEPYLELPHEWVPPRDKGAPGYFLWKEHKNGYVDLVEKVSIKILVTYYGIMPGKKIPYMQQHKAIFEDLETMLKSEFPGVPMRRALAMYPETIEQAVNELIEKEKVKTIVVVDFFHVYSALEEFNGLFPEIKDAVAERAKIIYAPFPGAYESYRKAYVTMAQDEIAKFPRQNRKLIVLTRHGFPELAGDPYPELSVVFYSNLKKEIEAALEGANAHVVFADTDFAGDKEDKNKKKLASFEALEMGLADGYDDIVFILVDFLSENTDTIFAMRLETFEKLHFKYGSQVPYPDFNKPYRTELQSGKTKITVAGTPVGERYRPHIAQGIFDAAATVLSGKEWPLLLLEEKKKKQGMF
jgi:protoheme ferro-lyase